MIKCPQLRVEYVNDNICVIDQNPARSRIPFDVPRTKIPLGEFVIERPRNCPQLALVFT